MSVLVTEDGIKPAAARPRPPRRSRRGGPTSARTARVKTAIVNIVGVVNDTLTSSVAATRSAESLLQPSHVLKTTGEGLPAVNCRRGEGRQAREREEDADEERGPISSPRLPPDHAGPAWPRRRTCGLGPL